MYIGVGQGTCKKSRPFPARAYTTLVVLVLNTDLKQTRFWLTWKKYRPQQRCIQCIVAGREKVPPGTLFCYLVYHVYRYRTAHFIQEVFEPDLEQGYRVIHND